VAKLFYTIIWIILILDSLFLILLVLAQESKSQGLGGLGGGMDLTFAGHTQRTAKRLTAIGGAIFVACIIGVILLMGPAGRGASRKLNPVATLKPSPTVTPASNIEGK